MWPVFILSSAMTAGVMLYILASVRDQKLALGLVVMVPVVALGLYMGLGRPDMPSHATAAVDYQKAHYAALAARPMETLLRHDPNDIGSLRVMGKIYMRMDDPAEAAKFFKRAMDIARAEKSIFYDVATDEYRAAAARLEQKKKLAK